MLMASTFLFSLCFFPPPQSTASAFPWFQQTAGQGLNSAGVRFSPPFGPTSNASVRPSSSKMAESGTCPNSQRLGSSTTAYFLVEIDTSKSGSSVETGMAAEGAVTGVAVGGTGERRISSRVGTIDPRGHREAVDHTIKRRGLRGAQKGA